MNIQTLAADSRTLTTCPTFVIGDDELPVECGAEIRVVARREVVGDDYGSWSVFDVSFECGHTLADMQKSLRHADEI